MAEHGISADDAVAINISKQRHTLTRTFAGRNAKLIKMKESPRDALARDIKNERSIYQYEKKEMIYQGKNESSSDFLNRVKKMDADKRNAFKKVIKINKDKYPNLYKK